jgi:hypothetical protein
MSVSEAEVEAAAKAGYEQRIRSQFHIEAGQSINPRLGQRTLSWDELPDKDIERSIARAALTAAEKVRENECELLRPQTLRGPAVDRDRAIKDDSGGP